MHKSFPIAFSHISNSYELVKKLSNTYVNDEFQLVSLDVISLFTNIPIELALDSIANRWNHISGNCNIPKCEFILAVKFVLGSTVFTFNGVMYQQSFGTPMGSPLSPIIADIVLQDLERRALDRLSFTLPFFVRYVDDLALAVPSSMVDHTLNTFNSFHTRLQFTVEKGEKNRLNFLDVTIILCGKSNNF